MDLETWKNCKQKPHQSKRYIQINISDADLIDHPSEENLILARFNQHYKSNNYEDYRIKELYLQYTKTGWKIIMEHTL